MKTFFQRSDFETAATESQIEPRLVAVEKAAIGYQENSSQAWVAVAVFAVSIFLFSIPKSSTQWFMHASMILALMALSAVTVNLLSAKDHRSNIAFSRFNTFDTTSVKRILLRQFSLIVVLIVSTIPVIAIDLFYAPILVVYLALLPAIFCFVSVYFVVIELFAKNAQQKDEWLDFALASNEIVRAAFKLKLNRKSLQRLFYKESIQNLFLGSILKSFFGTLYLTYYIQNFGVLQKQTHFLLSMYQPAGPEFTLALLPLLMAIAICFICTFDSGLATLGYLTASRLLGNEFRSVDKTISGWFVTLVCYHPFCLLDRFAQPVFSYTWPREWIQQCPLAWCAASSLILVLMLLYAWCNISFGLAFSNLTNRGIICSGPFRIVRHPTYALKLVTWWICTVPLCLNQDMVTAVVLALGMVVVTLVFYLRAITEENHLLCDQTYRDYCKLVRWRFIPGLV